MNEDEDQQSNDRILHAKNLLKKFQSKNQRNYDFDPLINSTNGLEVNVNNNNVLNINNSSSSSPLILPNFSKSASETSTLNEGNLINGPAGSSASELLPYNQKEANNQVRCYSVPENLRIDETDLNGSRSLLIQKQQELTNALSKLNSLHKSYSELYTAYNLLIEKNDANKDGRETPLHVNNVIQQLQIALTHALEEKTALQNELRDVKFKMEELIKSKNVQINSPLLQKNEDNFSDLRLASIQQEKDQLLVTITNLSQQIEQERCLSSNLEAKLFMAQQDKMDTQAHLKSIYQEKVKLENNFEKCKKELAMRDIYLKQLSKQFQFEHNFSQNNSKFEEVKNDEKENEKSLSNEEITSLKLELENSRKHVQTLQEQLQITSLQANSRLQIVEEELERSRAKYNEMCSLKDYLEESLRISQENIEKNYLKSKNTLNESVETEQNSEELDSLKTQISTLLKEKEEQFNFYKIELNKLNEEKNVQIEQLKNELNEAMERIGEFEHNKIMRENIDQDASALSIQLQNEKSTVSRAISQNLELKTQLGELQNRLVEVINCSAEKEGERLTAICTISKLTKALNELKENKDKLLLIDKQVQTEQVEEENDIKINIINDSLSDEQISDKISSTNDTSFFHDKSSLEDHLTINESSTEYSLIGEEEDKKQQFSDDLIVKKDDEEDLDKINKEEKEEFNKKEEDKIGEEGNENNEKEENIISNNNLLLQQQRLDQLYQENEQFRKNNQKLQYWLTALETENESIGEYVALYRFQRGNVQKRIAENETLLKEFKQQNYVLMTQLSHLCNSLNSFLLTTECNETSIISEGIQDSHNNELTDRQKQINNLRTLVQTLLKSLTFEQKTSSESICSVSKSNNSGNSSGGLQARCTGCVGCRGEMSNL